MQDVEIAGLKVTLTGKQELLSQIALRMRSNQKTWLTTPYSEFLLAALKDPKTLAMLNRASIAVPDGIGLFWARKFLCLPFSATSYWGKILQAFWQAEYSLAAVLCNPKWIFKASAPGEKIPGSELVWDLAQMAEKNNWSIYLLGGFDDVPKLAAGQLTRKYPGLKIAGYSDKNPDDKTIAEDIKKAAPDMLFVAYGPIRQEAWIAANLENLPVKLAVGLGGTFDYLAKKRLNPPKFMRQIGLEWLWRLFTQPHRLKRILNATFGLAIMLVRYKVFESYPFRPNVVSVIINGENKVLVCERSPYDFYVDVISTPESLKHKGYWQFPQGGLEKDESMEAAAKREALEETGLKEVSLIKISGRTHTYTWKSGYRKFWKNRGHKNRGQKQSIVYLSFRGRDSDVKVDQKEFVNYRWVDYAKLADVVHPERLALAKIVQADLKEMAEKAII